MATITSTPTGGNLTVNGNTQVSGTISWSKPTIPSGATISSCKLSFEVVTSMSKGSATVTVNGTTVNPGGMYTVDLGTSNNTTSVATTAKGENKNSKGTVSFSNLVYTVTYEEPVQVKTYTVTFVDWNGTVLKTQTVEEGSSATAPSNPSRVGYNFTGWDKSFNNITSDLTVTAQYEIDRSGLTSDTTALAIEYGVEKNLIINVDTLKISTDLSSIMIKNSQGDSSKTNTIFDWRCKSYSPTQNTVTFGITGTKNGTEIITVYDPNGNAELHITITVSGAPEEEPEIPEGIPVEKTIALRPISATQDSGYNNTWTDIANTYDTDTSTSGTIVVTGSSQTGFKRKYVDTIFNFDNPIPANATINSAVLTIRAKQSATTNLNITVSIGSDEVISSTLLSSSNANYTADIANYIKDLNQLNVNLTSAATSNRTFTLYDVRIDVNYSVVETGGGGDPEEDVIEWTGIGTVASNLSSDINHDNYKINIDWDNECFDVVITDQAVDLTDFNYSTIGELRIGDESYVIIFDSIIQLCNLHDEVIIRGIEGNLPATLRFSKNGIYLLENDIIVDQITDVNYTSNDPILFYNSPSYKGNETKFDLIVNELPNEEPEEPGNNELLKLGENAIESLYIGDQQIIQMYLNGQQLL